MLDVLASALKIIQKSRVHSYSNKGILICPVDESASGLRLGGSILNNVVDKTTVLFLSGGKTPKDLYQELAKEGKLHPGAIGLVDERYAEGSMHKESNEKMLADTGLLHYCKYTSIPVYLCLDRQLSREEAMKRYEEQLRTLFTTFRRHVAVLGIGLDGHTAGIPSTRSLSFQGEALESWMRDFRTRSKDRMVVDYDNKNGFYKERITMTFHALSKMDFLLVLVFGKEKKHALELLFSEGSEEEVPARFLKRPEVAKKTLLIPDQTI